MQDKGEGVLLTPGGAALPGRSRDGESSDNYVDDAYGGVAEARETLNHRWLVNPEACHRAVGGNRPTAFFRFLAS
jgi:hypothetical protein